MQETTEQQRNAAEILQELQMTPYQQQAVAEKEKDGFVEISGADYRGDIVNIHVGNVFLRVKPLNRRDIRRFNELVNGTETKDGWPDLIQFASAVRRPSVAGIDLAQTAELMTLFHRGRYEQWEAGRQQQCQAEGKEYKRSKAPDPTTEQDVLAIWNGLVQSFDDYEETILDTVELFTLPLGMSREDLKETLLEIEIPLFADLLRKLRLACGRFTKCLDDRTFFRPERTDTAQPTV